MSRKDQVVPCEATSELQVKYCLTRRGLALEQGNVMSFENHEKWAEKLFASRLNEPPSGYARVSFRQMQLADAKLFVVLGENVAQVSKWQLDLPGHVTSSSMRP